MANNEGSSSCEVSVRNNSRNREQVDTEVSGG